MFIDVIDEAILGTSAASEEERGSSLNAKDVSLTGANIDRILGAGPNAAGVKVNKETVLRNPAWWRGINLVSMYVAKMPLVVQQLTGNVYQPVTDIPAARVLANPNDRTISFRFRQVLTSNALSHGRGLARIVRRGATPLRLVWMNPEEWLPVVRVDPHTLKEDEDADLWWARTPRGTLETIPDRDVLHIAGLGYDGTTGYSVIKVLAEALGLGLAAQKYGATFFKNDATPGVVLKLKGALRDQQAIDRLKASWSNSQAGEGNWHHPAVLENDTDIQSLQFSNEDSQFLELRQFDLVEIANIIGVPPHKLGATVNTSYNSLEQENRAFLNDGLSGWTCTWEQECEKKLLPVVEAASGQLRIRADKSELQLADRKTEAEADVIEINNSIASVDEKRARRNLPPLPNGEGQKHRYPLNHGFLGEEPPPAPEPEPESEPERSLAGGRAEAILRKTVHRDCTRVVRYLCKDAKNAATKPGKFLSWLDDSRQRHVDYIVANLTPAVDTVTAVTVANDFVATVHDELLDASGRVQPQQLHETVSQLVSVHEADQPDILMTTLWKDQTDDRTQISA